MTGKFYITTPIYYVNDVPHLGHAYTSVLADVMARYQRFRGKEVFFLTGTDEHGAKISRAAEEKRKDIREFVDENSLRFKKLLTVLNISNDDFIRTSDERRHFKAVLKLWEKLKQNGDIYKDKYKGLYCVGCEAFITKKDMVDEKCVLHNLEPEVIEEENYFFRLSKYADKLKTVIQSGELKIFPESRKKESLAFIEEGLKDVSFSRPSKDIKWGIPVPGDAEQTIYVWCDALANYLSALGYASENENKFNKFWPADLHTMAKDILRFHTIIWPAMLMSAGLPLPKAFLIHGYISIGGKKMSKTLGNIVDPFVLADSYGIDALRYYFCREISPFEDGDFTEEKFKEVYNANLANGLGNYVSRVFKMALTYFEGNIKKPTDVLVSAVPLREKEVESYSIPYVFEHFIWPEYIERMENLEINRAADTAWSAISRLDAYIQDYQPFKMVKSDKEKTAAILWSLLFGLVNIAWMVYPFVSGTAEKILQALSAGQNKFEPNISFALKPIGTLFPRKE